MTAKQKTLPFRHETSAGCFVWRLKHGGEAEVLLVQPSPGGAWGIPKGHIEKRESMELCAIREVAEECGINVVITGVVPVVSSFSTNELKKTVWAFMALPVDSAEIRSNDENECVEWHPITRLPKIHAYQSDLVEWCVSQLRNGKDMPSELPERLDRAVREASEIFQSDVTWGKLKRHVMNSLPVPLRGFFSCYGTTHQNFVEREIIRRWQQLTNAEVVIPEPTHRGLPKLECGQKKTSRELYQDRAKGRRRGRYRQQRGFARHDVWAAEWDGRRPASGWAIDFKYFFETVCECNQGGRS